MIPDGRALSGLLLVDKPGLGLAACEGDLPSTSHDRLPTSHDVVQRVRRWSGQKRIGHTGTLDPLASGLLVLCLGTATRLVEYYQGHDKSYRMTVRLGVTTDSYDCTGQIIDQATVPPLTEAAIERALEPFRGTVQQRPPAFSAIKQGGEALYRRARRGEEIDLPVRDVTFHSILLISFRSPDRIELAVLSSAGAYMRSLAHDLGNALGCGATLTSLRREAAGPFRIEDAHTLEAIEQAAASGTFTELLLPGSVGLDLPRRALTPDEARRLGHGQVVYLEGPFDSEIAAGFDDHGELLGIIRRLAAPLPAESTAPWKADKWFVN